VDKPISRQYEERLFNYYGWPVFWGAPGIMMASPPLAPPADEQGNAPKPKKGDPCLRSILDVDGYSVESVNGTAGRISDFVVDDGSWKVRYIVIDLGHREGGKKVLISPDWAREIDWVERKVIVDLEAEIISESPEFRPKDPVNRVVEERLYDYYGRPRYWK